VGVEDGTGPTTGAAGPGFLLVSQAKGKTTPERRTIITNAFLKRCLNIFS